MSCSDWIYTVPASSKRVEGKAESGLVQQLAKLLFVSLCLVIHLRPIGQGKLYTMHSRDKPIASL